MTHNMPNFTDESSQPKYEWYTVQWESVEGWPSTDFFVNIQDARFRKYTVGYVHKCENPEASVREFISNPKFPLRFLKIHKSYRSME